MANMTPQRVTLITLGVADLDRSAKFYADLGWKPTRQQEGVVFYQINGMVLGLFGLGPLAKDQGRADVKLGTGAMTLAQNFRTTPEVDAAYAAAPPNNLSVPFFPDPEPNRSNENDRDKINRYLVTRSIVVGWPLSNPDGISRNLSKRRAEEPAGSDFSTNSGSETLGRLSAQNNL